MDFAQIYHFGKGWIWPGLLRSARKDEPSGDQIVITPEEFSWDPRLRGDDGEGAELTKKMEGWLPISKD